MNHDRESISIKYGAWNTISARDLDINSLFAYQVYKYIYAHIKLSEH